MNTKTKKIVQSFIIVPLLTTTLSINAVTTAIDQSVAKITQAKAISAEELALQKDRETKAAKIDAYYAKYNMPLEGYGMKMVLEAEEHGIDWRLIPAISVRESTGGINQCKKASFNPFGWGSCRIGFKSYDHAIETLAMNLGGDNPNTATHYDNKSTHEILQKYNPPSVVPKYAEQVIAIMEKIDDIQG